MKEFFFVAAILPAKVNVHLVPRVCSPRFPTEMECFLLQEVFQPDRFSRWFSVGGQQRSTNQPVIVTTFDPFVTKNHETMIITALQIQDSGTQREDEILFLIRETKGEPFSRLNLLKGEAFLFITMDFPFLNLIEFFLLENFFWNFDQRWIFVFLPSFII